MATFESTLQNSLKERLIEFTVESLCFIISYWIWTQTTELTIYLSQRPQNPSEYAGTLSALFLTGGSGAQHNISALTFCFSLSSSPASDLNPISQSQPETSESQGSCYNFSQRTKMLIIHYLISLKPQALREFFRINTSFIDSICGTQKIILTCPSVCKNNKKYVYTKRLNIGSLWAKCTRGLKKK